MLVVSRSASVVKHGYEAGICIVFNGRGQSVIDKQRDWFFHSSGEAAMEPDMAHNAWCKSFTIIRLGGPPPQRLPTCSSLAKGLTQVTFLYYNLLRRTSPSYYRPCSSPANKPARMNLLSKEICNKRTHTRRQRPPAHFLNMKTRTRKSDVSIQGEYRDGTGEVTP